MRPNFRLRTLVSLCLVALALSISAADDKKDPTAGKWIIESVTRDGKADDDLKGCRKIRFPPPTGIDTTTAGPVLRKSVRVSEKREAQHKGGAFAWCAFHADGAMHL